MKALRIIPGIFLCLLTGTLARLFQGSDGSKDRHSWIYYYFTHLKQYVNGE